jgi:hypothetical protein
MRPLHFVARVDEHRVVGTVFELEIPDVHVRGPSPGDRHDEQHRAQYRNQKNSGGLTHGTPFDRSHHYRRVDREEGSTLDLAQLKV